MLTTPLQMAMVAAAVANKGVLMRPTLIKEVISPGGSVIKRLHPHVYSVATKPATAGELKNMMVEVVQAGTGTAAQIPGVVVAGKTGTAETCACNTRLRRLVHLLRPGRPSRRSPAPSSSSSGDGFGGAVAAPIAKQLMQALLPTASNG